MAVLAPGAAVAQTAAQDPGGREGDSEGLLRQLDAARVPELWVYDSALLGGPGPQIPTLVWRMEVTPDEFVDFNELVLVDAQRDNVALPHPQTRPRSRLTGGDLRLQNRKLGR